MDFAIQLYTVREPLQQDFAGTLKQIAHLGFKGVEFAFNFGGYEPKELKELLDDLGLTTCGIYGNFPDLTDPANQLYDYAEALGCKYMTSGLGKQQLEEQFDDCLELCRKACTAAATRGIKICYHAHAHEFLIPAGNSHAMNKLLADIPEMLFEADTAWLHQGKEDIVGYLEANAKRIPLLHVKDLTQDGSFTELGAGVISFKEVLEFAKSYNIEWVSYEQDISDDSLKSATISLDHLKKLDI